MRASNLNKSFVLAVLIAAGSVAPTPWGEKRERQVDLVKVLFVSPVNVAPLGAQG